MLRSFLRHLLVGVGAVAALIFAATHTRPIYVGASPVAERLLSRDTAIAARLLPGGLSAVAMAMTSARAPWIHAAEQAVGTEQFSRDSAAFAADLRETGKVSPKRAEKLADVAVREAYRRRVPPALILGVMLTENDAFKSTARSRVGAVGLMQIHPKPWVRPLGKLFGRNLRDDETNLKYGIFILGHFLHRQAESGKALAGVDESWRTPLLRYNGCVRGTNTPGCHRYPDVVRRHVQRSARTLCAGRAFDDCVVRPVWASLQGGALERERVRQAMRRRTGGPLAPRHTALTD